MGLWCSVCGSIGLMVGIGDLKIPSGFHVNTVSAWFLLVSGIYISDSYGMYNSAVLQLPSRAGTQNHQLSALSLLPVIMLMPQKLEVQKCYDNYKDICNCLQTF